MVRVAVRVVKESGLLLFGVVKLVRSGLRLFVRKIWCCALNKTDIEGLLSKEFVYKIQKFEFCAINF
jgi:hypothetical protein